MTKPGMPESFKVLVKELRSLGLNLTLQSKEGKEVSIDTEEQQSAAAQKKGKGSSGRLVSRSGQKGRK
jgi:hypothetical protein